MKKFLIVVLTVFTLPAVAQPQVSHTITLTDAEMEAQAKINSLACKSVGLDDGGQICNAASFLSNKYVQVRQAEQAKAQEEAKVRAEQARAEEDKKKVLEAAGTKKDVKSIETPKK